MENSYSPINRSAYRMAADATDCSKGPDAKVASKFIGASSPDEIVFTKNATESMNLIVHSWARANMKSRRRGRAHPHGAPRQHRAVADARGRAGHRDPMGRADSRRHLDLSNLDHPARRREGVLVHRHVQRARHDHTDPRCLPTRPTLLALWPWSTHASSCRTTSPT